MSRQSVFTIAPHAPFLDTLAARLLDKSLLPDWSLEGPFALADVTIILPTVRAQRVLADLLADRLGGSALLPDIRTLGGVLEEEEPFLPPFDANIQPAAIAPLRRKLLLAELTEAWATREAADPAKFTTKPSPSEILSLAESLAELIDDFHVEQLTPDALRSVAPDDLATNWQASLEFLEIAIAAWPKILTELGRIDGAMRRNGDLARRVDALSATYGARPVIAAGSTGSMPATANLLRAIQHLPRGLIILPGLDTDMPTDVFDRLSDPANAPHGHAQYGLVKLLQRLGRSSSEVTELAPTDIGRTHLVRTALALPDDTALWAEKRRSMETALPNVLGAVAVSVAATDEEQARAIAIAARAALTDNKTVGIISPDRNLARRIASELRRFDIEVDDSAGTPLFQSRAARLLRQCLALVKSSFGPVDMMAFLRNRHTSLGLSRKEIAKLADRLEYALLRGNQPGAGIAGLRRALADNVAQKNKHAVLQLTADTAAGLTDLFARLETAFAPLVALLEKPVFSAPDFAQHIARTLASVTETDAGQHTPEGEEWRVLQRWCADLAALGASGPALSTHDLDAALESLMAQTVVRPRTSGRADIAIWGLLEARLQAADLMILTGLSENVWPEPADPGPWLSRGMRLAIGLEPPERRQGQAAHDFEMAMGNTTVLLTRSERIGTSPALASRLLQRLEAFIGVDETIALHDRGKIWVEEARRIDWCGAPVPARPPQPCPPASARPKTLSITEIETLIRSPYDLYAKYVLGLRAIDPLGADPDRRERGTVLHLLFERFVTEIGDPTAPDAEEKFFEIADKAFAELSLSDAKRQIWSARFRTIGRAFLEFERRREPILVQRFPEAYGRLTVPVSGVDFVLRGQADRIDQFTDGRLEIIDFKTGATPDRASMKDFTAPQLLLEAEMAAKGAFDGVPAGDLAALTYAKIGAGPDPFNIEPLALASGLDIAAATDEVMRRLAGQVDAYLLSDTRPLPARIFPNPKQRYSGDYDHLARVGEWAMAEGEDES